MALAILSSDGDTSGLNPAIKNMLSIFNDKNKKTYFYQLRQQYLNAINLLDEKSGNEID